MANIHIRQERKLNNFHTRGLHDICLVTRKDKIKNETVVQRTCCSYLFSYLEARRLRCVAWSHPLLFRVPFALKKHSQYWTELRHAKCWPTSSSFQKCCKKRSAKAQNLILRLGNECRKSSGGI